MFRRNKFKQKSQFNVNKRVHLEVIFHNFGVYYSSTN